MDEREELHRQEIGDCPVDVKNQQEGFRPVLRAEVLIRDDGKTLEDYLIHLCGEKLPGDIATLIHFLSREMIQVLNGPEDGVAAGETVEDGQISEELKEKIDRKVVSQMQSFRVMRRSMASLLSSFLPSSFYDEVIRVDGSAICQHCRLEYRDHPEVQPTFHVRCDGILVKT